MKKKLFFVIVAFLVLVVSFALGIVYAQNWPMSPTKNGMSSHAYEENLTFVGVQFIENPGLAVIEPAESLGSDACPSLPARPPWPGNPTPTKEIDLFVKSDIFSIPNEMSLRGVKRRSNLN